MLNEITIMGRLTRDADLRYTQAGTPVANFTVAVDRDIADDAGNRETDFIDAVAWDKKATFVSDYFQKGDMIVVSGRLQIRDWMDKEDNKRRSAEIHANNVYFGQPKRNDEPANEEPPARGKPAPAASGKPSAKPPAQSNNSRNRR